MSLTVRVIDCTYGRPVAGMPVRLERDVGRAWIEQVRSQTDDEGRLADWLPDPLARGVYRLEFDLDGYFASRGIAAFYPSITIVFRIADPNRAPCIPLLITSNAFMTYRQDLL
ncbi:MAG: hydroxyisourate hydrolase [Micromonosporaceae bacterium]